MEWPAYSSTHRVFDAPRDVVYDLVLATIQARTMPVRLLAENRTRGLIDIRLASFGLSRPLRVTVSIAPVDRRTTEVAVVTPARALPRLRARADDGHRFDALLDAIDDGVRAAGYPTARPDEALSLPA